jgi:hypothetical protein
MGAKVRRRILAAAGVLMALVALTVGLVIGGRDGLSAKPLPRGSLVAVPDKPAVLNRPAVVKTFDGVRAEVQAPALARSDCLDAAAGSLAASFGGGAVPTMAPTTCGRADWGWVAGVDRTGAAQARAAYGRTPTGPSPLVGKAARRLGVALGPRRASGTLTGYVLVWVVSA